MQTAAVSAYLAPIIERYRLTLTTYTAVDDRITRMLGKNGWDKEDSRCWKADIDYANKLRRELDEAERDMRVASDLLVCLFGEVEAPRQFPELWQPVMMEAT